MSTAIAPTILGGLAGLLMAPEAAAMLFAVLAAGLGLWLHATLPPPDDAAIEAAILAAGTGM